MINERENKSEDTVCDFCTGTGSFLIKSSIYSKNLIGCENNDERYSLAKCNFILHDLDSLNLFHNSCFNQKFDKYDKVIINPPFSCPCPDSLEEDTVGWKDFKEEQKFVLYQVQLLKDGGIGACIIPRSNLNNTVKKTNEFKQLLLKYCTILKIINCNSKVFVPNASVECAIIIFKKEIFNTETLIYDYTEDGYEIKKNNRIKVKDAVIKEQTRLITYDNDWNFQKEINLDLNIEKLINEYNKNNIFKKIIEVPLKEIFLKLKYEDLNQYKYLIQINGLYFDKNFIFYIPNNVSDIYYLCLTKLSNQNIKQIKNNFDENFLKINNDIVIENAQLKEWQNLKIGDYFSIESIKNKFKIKKSEEGKYPLISSSGTNNGISKYINNYSFEGECLTIARNGTVGSCFYQNGIFGITSDVLILTKKRDLNYHIWAMMINYILPKKYSYSNKLTIEKLLNEIILIPIFN
jgi:tRNA1(Val) A37 N6-methylase TrmN6